MISSLTSHRPTYRYGIMQGRRYRQSAEPVNCPVEMNNGGKVRFMKASKYRIAMICTLVACLLATSSCSKPSTPSESLPTVDEVVKFAMQKSSGYKDWSADFLQSLRHQNSEMRISGKLFFKSPNQGRSELTFQPGGSGSITTLT